MPRGGRRPGAGAPKGNTNARKSRGGAPKGNTNALKYGRYSKRLKYVLDAMAQQPELCKFLTDFRRRQLRSERLAAAVLRRALTDFVGGNPAPDNPLLVFVRKDRPSTDPHDSQAKEANRSKNQSPLFPPDPLQKSEKNLKDNPKWRIN